MAIDKTRFKDYLAEMQDLQSRVSEDNFIRRFEEKLLDLLSRNQIDTRDLTFIRNEVERLFKPEFAGFDTRIKQTYNDVLDVVNELYDDIGNDIQREFSKVRAVEETNQLQLGEYERSTIDAVARKVRKGIIEDMSHTELTREIREIGGKAGNYAETLAGTQLKRFGRVSKYNKSLIANVEVFEYAGVLRDTTRPFCRYCLHKLFHISNLLKMKNGNLEPVIINCGGWNCIHDLEPDPTATREDAVSGRYFSLQGGAKIYGGDGSDKIFNYSKGLESLADRKGIQNYINKAREVELKQSRIDHIKSSRYDDISDQGIRIKVGQIRSNPDKVHYQYNNGPRIVFEKDDEFAFISARKVHTMIKPSDPDKFREHFVNYMVELKDYD